MLPGSNFFGKMPLFFRYNGVNAVNLQAKRRQRLYTDKKMPLTLLYQKKTCVYKKSDFLTPWRMRNSRSIIYLTKDYEAFRAYFLESVRELQGTGVCVWTWRHIGSVIELATAKQVYKKVHFTTRLVVVLQKFRQF